MLEFICYPNCSTCRRAQKWLDDHAIAYKLRDIKTNPPTEEELRTWQAASGLPLRRFFNTSGLKYKELRLKDRLPGMEAPQQLSLLASDGMLVRRPLLIRPDGGGHTVLLGFKEAEWQQLL